MSAALLAGVLVGWATGGHAAFGTASAGTATALLAPGAGPSPSTSTSPTPPPQAGAPTAAALAPDSAASGPSVPVHVATPTAGSAVPPPDLLAIARIGLRMPVQPVALAADGEMALPPTPEVAGWYAYGPAPGTDRGASVIAGHVDTAADGVGPMAGLAGLRVGDDVEVRSGATVHHYRVTSVLAVHKTTLDLAALFDRGGPPRLHLVTCGGRYDRVAHHYEDNVVVVATPVA
ncbi:MAG: class F sortase [Lapillicoccus sp.]